MSMTLHHGPFLEIIRIRFHFFASGIGNKIPLKMFFFVSKMMQEVCASNLENQLWFIKVDFHIIIRKQETYNAFSLSFQ